MHDYFCTIVNAFYFPVFLLIFLCLFFISFLFQSSLSFILQSFHSPQNRSFDLTNDAYNSFLSRFRNNSRTGRSFSSYIARVHDTLLRRALRGEQYLKLYSYHYLINGFAVLVTPQQVWHQPNFFTTVVPLVYL